MSSPPHRPRLSSLMALVAVAATCLVFSPPALAGDPLTSIKINEVESDGLADFIELTNISVTPTDVSGLILKDNDNSRTLAIPAATSIPAGGFLAVDTDVGGGFGMGAADAARVFMPNGTTQIDGYSWTFHAFVTFGRCPDGTGDFVTNRSVTKGAANDCPVTQPWPGSQSVTAVDQAGVLGADVSGLKYEGSGTTTPGVLWAVDNSGALLLRLVWDGTQWVRDTTNDWSLGKTLRYPGGAGTPDSEGVTLTDAGSAGGVFVSSERDGANGAVSRPSVLRYDVSGAGTTLTATREWNLTADLPAVPPNEGTESVEWVPDAYLVGAGFVDQTTDLPYNPAAYPNHGTGLFFVGLEANGIVYAYALDQTSSSFTRVATFDSGFFAGGVGTFGALHWESPTNQLWVVCDNNCDGRSRVFEVDAQAGPTLGDFVAVRDYRRPTGMGNLNNEGFAMASADECVGGSKPVFWADDGNTDLRVLRAGTISCSPPAASAWSAPAPVTGDFNGDGFADLAVAVPGENAGAGVVHVLRGSAGGLTATSSQYWTQNSTGIASSEEPGDQFGASLAAGDLTGDGIADLAVGAPGENGGEGAVHVLKGSVSGLTATGSQFWSQSTSGISGDPAGGDHFGASLAIGDFGGSSHGDLAIGVPDENTGARFDDGGVHVLPGTASGPTATGQQLWSQSTSGISDSPESGDRFGATLAAGNLGDSAHADLAIGAPGENVGAGVVHAIYGTASGLAFGGQQLWSQDSSGIGGGAEANDHFGASLTIGDFGGSAESDLAIGVPDEDSVGLVDDGLAHVLPGSATGLTATGSQLWHQAVSGISDSPESGDRFGATLAAGNLGDSAHADLAIGAPGENVGAGVVHAIYGTVSGLAFGGQQLWSQDSSGVSSSAEPGDHFGASLAIANFGGSAESELAIGVPDEDSGVLIDDGGLHVLAGSATGLTGTGQQFWSQASSGITDSPESGDRFGGGVGR